MPLNPLIAAILATLLSACGSAGNRDLDIAELPKTALVSESDGMRLEVSPDSLVYGARLASVNLSVSEQEDGSLLAEVSVEDAKDLRALYFSISYDTGHWHAVASSAARQFGRPSELLSLGVLDTREAMHHGQLYIHPQNAEGFSGSGKLATVHFERGALGSVRAASKAPTGPGSRSDISYELNTTYGLFWHYYNQGDYDQNGEVNISDLTPLGIHLKEVGPFGPATIPGMIDGDANGEINLADITPIGANFGARVSSYNLYASDDFDDFPADNGPSTIEPYATKDFMDYQLPDAAIHPGPLPKEGRLFYKGDILSQPQGQQDYNYYWVRSSDGVTEGMPSYVLASPRWSSNPGKLQPPSISFEGLDGAGNFVDPFVASAGSETKVTVTDPLLGDISTHPDMRYRFVTEDGTPWPYASLSNSDAILRIDPAAPTGDGILHLQFFFGVLNFSQGIHGGLRGQGGPWGQYFKVGDPLAEPLPVATISPEAGIAPLTVSFDAAASSSPNGTLTDYAWKFDKFGTLTDGSSEPSGQYTFTDPGVYVVELTVTDSWFQRASTQVIITALEAPGGPPVASILGDETFGNAPLTVSYTAENSSASEGRSIVKYEWDIDGDAGNGFELDTGDVPFAQFTYEEAVFGFSPSVRVTDDQGDNATGSTKLTLFAPLSDPPKIDLQIDVTQGSSPLTVNFDASGSTDNGTIVKWGWDFDGDGSLELFDTSDPPAGPMASFSYATSGSFHGYVYAWDDDDETSFKQFIIRTDGAPTAAIEYPGGPFIALPAPVEFDASASFDLDGSIVEYRWDFDEDGVPDETTTEPLTTHVFMSSGSKLVTVTVVDDSGLTDWAYTSFSIF
ncbi:MAG: PKD domain-containing protein [Planctomycetales bacterium]|nr:MAG: PKD domain-containing protein [Planctomycetales bacterium]